MSSAKSLEILETAQEFLKEARASIVLSQRQNKEIQEKVEKLSQVRAEVPKVTQKKESEAPVVKVASDEFGIGEVGRSAVVNSGHPLDSFLDNLEI